MAGDHFAYVGAYRKCIDSLQQLIHELWQIVMNDKSSLSDKTAAMKEIHNIEKTKVLLLRDLPFITRLSKYYDLTLSNSSLSIKLSNSIDNKPKPIPNLLDKENKDRYENLTQFDNIDVSEALEILKGYKLDMNNNPKTTTCKNIDDPVLEDMQRQSQTDDSLN